MQRLEVAGLDHHQKGLAEQEVADQNAGLVAPDLAGRRLAAPHVGFVDHVVMQKRRIVHELDGGGVIDLIAIAGPEQCRAGQGQHRSQALAAGFDQVMGQLRHEFDMRIGPRQNERVDLLHVGMRHGRQPLESVGVLWQIGIGDGVDPQITPSRYLTQMLATIEPRAAKL